MKVEFLNSIETAIFGEFNNGQIEGFPKIRIKSSTWVDYICF